MNKILWLSVGLISMVSLHGMDEDDTTALRVSMACGFATGAGVVGGLGSMAVDYCNVGNRNNKRDWDVDDSKIEGSCAGLGVASALFVILAVTDSSNHTMKEIFPGNNIQNAFLVGLALGTITGGSLVCTKINQMQYNPPVWESLLDKVKRLEKQHNLPHQTFSARITEQESKYIKNLESL